MGCEKPISAFTINVLNLSEMGCYKDRILWCSCKTFLILFKIKRNRFLDKMVSFYNLQHD